MFKIRCDDISILTPQEFRIFKRYGEPTCPTAIAKEMSLSVKTISTYLTRMVQKFGCKDVQELKALAILKFAQYEVDPFIFLKVPEGWTKGEDLLKISLNSTHRPGIIRAVDADKYQSSQRLKVHVIKFETFEERDFWVQWWHRKEKEAA